MDKIRTFFLFSYKLDAVYIMQQKIELSFEVPHDAYDLTIQQVHNFTNKLIVFYTINEVLE